ncbi:MAG: hypothetical protein PWQ82_214 [Thermosediminibacterales bacterium]|nr:hypothetical protein [Thermosediminibacterales bacterium]MDK2835236.1 hypothetical protein [Thermosediminibacterales bacterium]
MITTLLFDLDGTLLPIDTDDFIEKYMQTLVPHLAHFIPPQTLAKEIMNSTYAMIKNKDPQKTNKDVFIEDFFSRVPYSQNELMPIFDDFYNNKFKELKKYVNITDENKRVLPIAKEKGYDIIIATNPVFPMSAIKERLNWIEALDIDLTLITAYENMHFCKPNLEYYEEILQIAGKKPSECIMFGNDVEEDLVAGKLGIKTFLVEDFLINRNGKDFKYDYRGKLKDVIKFINEVL